MKIGILNVYDARNLGDYAIVETQTAWLRRLFPDCQIRFFSHHAQDNVAFFGKDSVESILCIPPSGSPLAKLVKPFCDWLRYYSPSSSRPFKFLEFDSCDLYVLCGGGYLYSSMNPVISRNLYFLCLTSLIAVKTGKPVLQFPQSYGPLTKVLDRFIVKKLVAALSVAVGRCHSSIKFLQKLDFGGKAILVPDIALAMRSLFPNYFSQKYHRTGLGIAPIDFRFAIHSTTRERDEYLQKLIKVAIEYYKTTGETITLFMQVSVTDKDDDSIMARHIYDELQARNIPVKILEYTHELQRYLQEFQKIRVLIGCRMHACIFSLLCGTPAIGLSYQPKFVGLYEQLKIQQWLKPINNWEVDWLLDSIKEILENETSYGDKIILAVTSLGNEIDAKLQQSFSKEILTLKNEAAAGRIQKKTDSPSFSIITPSYKQLKWLKLSALSVADQKDVQVEHIIQDAGTGTELNEWVAAHTKAKLIVESDSGMYDAINRGFRQAGSDIVAWLNCDEQYLPGTLEKVALFFSMHPEIDVLFGDALLIGEQGELLSYRRAILPKRLHIQLSHLNILSCATFVRRSVLERGFYLKPEWKAIADAVWVSDMLKGHIPMAVLNEPLSVFTITESNLGQTSLAYSETKRWQKSTVSPAKSWLRIPVIVLHRLHKLFAGAYRNRQIQAKFYTQASPVERKLVQADRLSFTWVLRSESMLKSAPRRMFQKLLDTFKQVEGSTFDHERFMSSKSRPISDLSFPIFALIPLFIAGIILYVDQAVTSVVLAPTLLTLTLFGSSFFLTTRRMAFTAVIFLVSVFIALRFFQPQPFVVHNAVYWTQIFIRCFGFITCGTIAVFASAYRLRAERYLGETLTILDKMPTPALVSDAAGFIIFVNEEAARFLKTSNEKLIGKRYVELFTVDRDEGNAMRFYIRFFEDIKNPASNVRLVLNGVPKPIDARLICVGEGHNRYLITVLALIETLTPSSV